MKLLILNLFCVLIFSINANAENLPLTLNWGNQEAEVTETIDKGGQVIKVQYKVKLKQVDEDFLLIQSDFKLVSINGEEISDSRLNKMLTGTLSIPELKLDDKGQLIEVINQEKYFDNFIASIPDPRAKSMYENPEIQDAILMQGYQKWCYWVCIWTDKLLPLGAPVVAHDVIDFMGVSLPMKNTITNDGPYNDSDELINLSFVSETDFDNPEKLVENLTDRLDVKVKPTPEEKIPSGMSKNLKVNARVEAKTMKPVLVEVHTVMSMDTPQGKQTKEEKNKYEFVWE